MPRTDNLAEIGMHVFERAGLGKAPFRVVGCEEKYITHPDGTTQASGSCQYCGMGIRYVFIVLGADDRQFGVGCDCVERSGDRGLIKGYKNNPDYRAAQRAKRHALADRKHAEYLGLLSTHESLLKSIEFAPRWDGTPQTAHSYYSFCLNICGAAGTARYLKALRALIEKHNATAA